MIAIMHVCTYVWCVCIVITSSDFCCYNNYTNIIYMHVHTCSLYGFDILLSLMMMMKLVIHSVVTLYRHMMCYIVIL